MTNLVSDALFEEVWRAFQEQIKSDEDAADALYQAMVESNQTICGCALSQISHDQGERFYTCNACRKDVWLTSGTLLDGVVRLRAWMAAIFFNDYGVAVSAARLARLVQVASSTALNIHKKLAMVVCEEMPEADTVSSYWFSPVIFKRSRQTPAECHPREEVLSSVQDDFGEQPLDLALEHVVTEYVMAPVDVKLAVSQFVGLISHEFHGISRKCLQLYLASYWCIFDRVRWGPGVLLRACLRHTPISYEQVLNFVSAPRVMIMLPCT
ncbi:MAG: hypothetical protein WC714_07885 [Candidatus Obscuribacterales bacterium]|jgi:hypothetical protein